MVNEAIVGLALRDKESLEAALLVCESYNAIRQNILNDFLFCVQDGLARWAADRDSDWEVKSEWESGNWVQNPLNKKWLPLFLRKKQWPSMVGIAVQAEQIESKEIIIGVIAPVQTEWNKDSGMNERFYEGTQTFADQASRERIAQSCQNDENRYETSPWWPVWEWLKDETGLDIHNWSDRKILARLHGEKEPLCRHIISKMVEFAEKIGNLQINVV
jgi:hypothetical protein